MVLELGMGSSSHIALEKGMRMVLYPYCLIESTMYV
jgi:hypothetical protein